jgi:2-keto-3-deoxy-L-rhamnonate aldolase RhmA
MPRPSLKARLSAGEVVVGPIMFELATPGLAVLLADVGFDFMFLDLEHAALDSSTLAHTMLAASQAGMSTIVKMPDLARSWVQRFLDYGATAIQVPHVESAEEARLLVRWGRYPPLGERGQVFGLGNTGYRAVDRDAFVAQANADTMMIAMIETRGGVERVDEIVSVEGLDMIFIGTGDLSSSYGVPGQMTHAIVNDAAEHVVAACKAAGKYVAINAEEPDVARHWIERGVQLIGYSTDIGMIRKQSRAMLDPIAPLLATRRVNSD